MPDISTIAAEGRERAGKGAARALRRGGRLPGVIYGGGEEPVMISLDPAALIRELHKPGFFTRLYDVEVNGAKHRALARDVQLDVVTEQPLHIDFLRVSARTRISVNVPVAFVNEEESPGIKRGGVLNIVRHEVELICAAAELPQELVVDLAGLDIGDSVHVSAIELPADAEPAIRDRDFTIATIAAPTLMPTEAEEAEAEEAEAAEGEEAEGEAGAEEDSKE